MTRPFTLLLLACVCAPGFGDGGFFTRDAAPLGEPDQGALIVHQNGVEDLVLKVSYEGAVGDFAWVVPTPDRPAVEAASKEILKNLLAYTNPPRREAQRGQRPAGGFGGGGAQEEVRVLERRVVGIFDTAVLDAKDPDALLDWLERNGYAVPQEKRPVLDRYIRKRWCFTAMRIGAPPARGTSQTAPAQHSQPGAQQTVRTGELSPVRFTFETRNPVYPLAISSVNSGNSEMLLFLVTEQPIATLGFQLRFRGQVSAKELNRLIGGKPRITGPMWLTRLSRKMAAEKMRSDLYFAPQFPGRRG